MPESLIAIMAESLPTHFLRSEFNSRAIELKRTFDHNGAFSRAIEFIYNHSMDINRIPGNKINDLIHEIMELLDGYYGSIINDGRTYYFEEL